MPEIDSETPRADDDTETAERKSKTVDERIPERSPDILGREGPLEGGSLGPGEAALELERRAARTPTRHG